MKKYLYSPGKMILIALFLMVAMPLLAQNQTYSITIVQPYGGEHWARGTAHLISWTDNLSQPVKILLSSDGGTTYPDTISPSESGSTYTWDIPSNQTPSSSTVHYKIKIVSTVDPSISAESGEFYIDNGLQGMSITVQQPDISGIYWAKGETYLISWVSNNMPGEKYDITLLHYNSGGDIDHSYSLASNIDPSTFSWTINTDLSGTTIPSGDNYKIKITGHTQTGINGISTHTFTITDVPYGGSITVIQPNGGETWVPGSMHLISWTGNLGNENYDITLIGYSSNGSRDTTYTVVNSGVQGSTYSWAIPGNLATGDRYRILVSGHTLTNVSDSSNNYFYIRSIPNNASINIFQPSSNDEWAVGTSHLISWTDNLGDPVDIYLSTDDGVSYDSIKTGATGSTWTWDIPTGLTPSNNCKIKIQNSAGSVTAVSGTFKILAHTTGGQIVLVQPNISGISWAQGTSHLISWTDNLSENVKIYLTDASGNNPVLLTPAGGVSGSTWTWDISPGQATGSYKIKIESVNDASISGISANSFAISEVPTGITITIYQPSGGEQWALGSQHLISWSSNLTSLTGDNFDISLVNLGVTPDTTILLYSNVPPSTYTWTIDQAGVGTGSHYKIKISGHTHTSIEALSNEFSLINAPSIKAYPNPSNSYVTINLDHLAKQNYVATVFNRFGNKLFSKTINTNKSDTFTFSTLNLPEGIYFVTIVGGKEKLSQMVIVQH